MSSESALSKTQNGRRPPLEVARLLEGKKLVVIGGTGFLGKVWWAFLLSRFPEFAHMYLVVRPKEGQSAEQRFWEKIATSEVLVPLREQYGSHFEAFLRQKVTPIAGDVAHPFCGLSPELRDDMRGGIAAVVNAAGVVDFDPPLDEALDVNAFGVQNLVQLARDLGDVPLLHTSTCYVAGSHTGPIEEVDPREFPFPRADELERSHWDPDREIAECLDVIEQARHRASDAFRQSRFLDEAKQNLKDKGEPARGAVLEAEVARVKRKFVEGQLSGMGMERAQFWGFPNTYTYTKSIGEQIIASSGLPYTIVRPAVVESTMEFPFPGWNEGINTSAPLIFIVRQGGLQIPGSDNVLDVIPCDMVAGAMTLALAELIEGTAPPVYQAASSDSNPCTMRRFFELTGLYKRRYYRRTGKGGPLVSFLQAHYESALLDKAAFESIGPMTIAKGARALSGLLKSVGAGPLAPVARPTAKAIEAFADQQQRVGKILNVFVPFTAQYDYRFRCDNTRAAFARLGEHEKRLINWTPETINWRDWFMEVHIPALERHVFPEIDKRLERPLKAPRRHETLVALLDEMADRYELAVALQRTEQDGLSRISFRQWRELSMACATRLRAAGVERGDRVLLAGSNHPAWPVAFFGILFAGATVVPLESGVEAAVAENLARASKARWFLADAEVKARVRSRLEALVQFGDLTDVLRGPGDASEPVWPASEDVAALIYTSGTTGTPKGVMLSHGNLTALIASLAPLFPLRKGDRILSVLPLHHTFELTCGMLLPLSRGARVVYLDELNAERLEYGLKAGRITGLIGVPALWEMLERRITNKVAEHGSLASHVFDYAVELNQSLGKNLGLDVGRLLFGPVHQGLGGHLRFMVSGGAALPEATQKKFAGLGMHLAEGYGLTEASPVLTVALAKPGSPAGQVGKPIPGVEIRIDKPNAEGVGEVLARGPNVMLGYADNPEATAQSIDEDGWLHTGDLGKLDKKNRLVLVGRAKDVIVTNAGENIYPDDLEARLGKVDDVEEYSILGVPDGRGGERIACVAVPAANDQLSRQERHERAKRALEKKYSELPLVARPAVTTVQDAKLPRTTTRKVKRKELARLLERLDVAATQRNHELSHTDNVEATVRAAIGSITRRQPAQIQPNMTLRGDLAFDSLMALELLVALETKLERTLDAEKLQDCSTVGEIESFVRASKRNVVRSVTRNIETEDSIELSIPPQLRDAAMHWMGVAQHSFYDRVLSTTVTGRAFIPYNKNTLVAANHQSHLDMGLVKYALGSYGKDLVSLAAQDYFFEGNRWRKAYFENFTNLVPMPRGNSLRQALRQAGGLLEAGKTVLIFPEGTRSPDGQLGEFKSAVGHLALHHKIDILPVWLGGTHAALPKGASVPRRRDVTARIGPPLRYEELKRLTQGMRMTDASRAVARLTEKAVRALSTGGVFDTRDLSPDDMRLVSELPPETLEPVFEELKGRFVAGSVKQPVSYYFSLGDSERWTVRITPELCEVYPGKVINQADCVLKTSPDIFTRIVRESYTPSPQEFISGMVKSNNVGLLLTFQKAFQLQHGSN